MWTALCLVSRCPWNPTPEEKRFAMEETGFHWSDKDWEQTLKLWRTPSP